MSKNIKGDVTRFLLGDGFNFGEQLYTREFRMPDLKEYLEFEGYSATDINDQMCSIIDEFIFKVKQGGLDHIMSCDISSLLKSEGGDPNSKV